MSFYASLRKIAISSVLMWLAILLLNEFLPWHNEAPFSARLLCLSASVGWGMAVFFTASWVQRSPELVLFVGAVRRKIVGS